MKQLLLHTIACCAVLLPFSQAEAKSFGGFSPGKTFTFTVKVKTVTKTTGFTVKENAPVPDGVPNFKKGEKVTFTVGAKGQLTAKGMSIPFKKDGNIVNTYITNVTSSNPRVDLGHVYKTRSDKPTGVGLSFTRTKGSGLNTSVTAVAYALE